MPHRGTTFSIFEANNQGRDFIVGDIHGHFESLETLLGRVNFNYLTDRVFATGDIIDRGPLSNQVIHWLDQPWLHTVRGNHEQMAIDAYYGGGDKLRHSRNGGAWFYQCLENIQNEIAARFQRLPIAIQLTLRNGKTIGIIHAELPDWDKGLSWQQGLKRLESDDETKRQIALTQALYARSRINNKNTSSINGLDFLYVGHSTVSEVLRLGNVIYLDTGCSFSDGRLTLIDLQTGTQYSA
ncbi:metallophosphoesterase [Pseudomonas sp. Rh2]|uniref:metallophosphoesterase n=1 Tax=unclassified Pseudomonas TaxID=196821 RepID=UPI00345DEC86